MPAPPPRLETSTPLRMMKQECRQCLPVVAVIEFQARRPSISAGSCRLANCRNSRHSSSSVPRRMLPIRPAVCPPNIHNGTVCIAVRRIPSSITAAKGHHQHISKHSNTRPPRGRPVEAQRCFYCSPSVYDLPAAHLSIRSSPIGPARFSWDVQLLFYQCTDHLMVGRYRCMG